MNPTPDPASRQLARKALSLLVPTLTVATLLIAGASMAVGAQPGVGVSWSVVPSPAVPPTPFTTSTGVSCTSASFCAAVGPATETWNGSSWSVVPGAISGFPTGVSCSGPSACMAVGTNASAESWNGSAWTSSAPAIPSGSTSTTFSAVSCSGPSACTAVGYYAPTVICGPEPPCDQVLQATLAESWNGSVWSIVPSPNGYQTMENSLNGVSCTGPSACTAVGGTSGGGPLIESWNGSVWSSVPSPSVLGGTLIGVSCTSSSACTAVGSYTPNGELPNQTLIESWDGSAWSVVPSPNTSSNDNEGLTGVSCSRPLACTAVASYSPNNNPNVTLTLIESWNGSVWSIVPSPDPLPTGYNALSAVSCWRPRHCAAVGVQTTASGSQVQPLIESSTKIRNGEAPAITSGAQADFTVGMNGMFTVTSTGRPTAFVSEAGSLPNGVSFVDNGDGTATLSGTPTTTSVGAYPIVITASNGVSPEATQSFTLRVEGPPTTSLLVPSEGATLSGSTDLDASASDASSVEFLLFGGSYGFDAPVVCTATATLYGWLCAWNTTTAPNGSYILVAEASNSFGNGFSSGVDVSVNNPASSTTS
jgi:hypothetical protein